MAPPSQEGAHATNSYGSTRQSWPCWHGNLASILVSSDSEDKLAKKTKGIDPTTAESLRFDGLGFSTQLEFDSKIIDVGLYSTEGEDLEFRDEFASYFPKLYSEWSKRLDTTAKATQKHMRWLGQTKRKVEGKDIQLLFLSLKRTKTKTDAFVRLCCGYRLAGPAYSGEESYLLDDSSTITLTADLDWKDPEIVVNNS